MFFFLLFHLLTPQDTGRIDVLAVSSAAGSSPVIDPSPIVTIIPSTISVFGLCIMIKGLGHHEENTTEQQCGK